MFLLLIFFFFPKAETMSNKTVNIHMHLGRPHLFFFFVIRPRSAPRALNND